MTPERAPQPLGDKVMDFLADLDADRDTKGQSIVRVYDLLEPVSAFTEAAIAEALEQAAQALHAYFAPFHDDPHHLDGAQDAALAAIRTVRDLKPGGDDDA